MESRRGRPMPVPSCRNGPPPAAAPWAPAPTARLGVGSAQQLSALIEPGAPLIHGSSIMHAWHGSQSFQAFLAAHVTRWPREVMSGHPVNGIQSRYAGKGVT